MIATFPTPVLSVAADVVRDLQGGDALCGLWMLFTKCKDSMQDGRRLENISWRLWYREMMASQSYRPLTPESASPDTSGSSSRDSFFFLPKNDTSRESHYSPDPSAYRSPAPSSAGSQIVGGSSTTPQPNHRCKTFRYPKPNTRVGRMIYDILPIRVALARKPISTISRTKSCETPCNATVVPSVRLPSPPPPSSSVFPRVVVVNPTPNPTPHPTPPATPLLATGISAPSLHPPSTHLVPPLPPPAMLHIKPSLQHQAAASSSKPPPPSLPPPAPEKPPDETLKPSDRRFFLQQSPEGHSSERDGSTDGCKAPSDIVEESSWTSSQCQAENSVESRRPAVPKPRKGKEVSRHYPVRGSSHRPARNGGHHHTAPPLRRSANTSDRSGRPTFDIGSNSSTGSKSNSGRGASRSRSPLPPLEEPVPVAKPCDASPQRPPVQSPVKPNTAPTASTAAPRRRVIVANTSSEYETTDTDDLWESEDEEDASAEDKERIKQETQIREAALEAQRQREMFAKVPKRSYSNLTQRSKSGLLSALMKPDPTIFPPNHPYRTSHSSHDIAQLPSQPAAPVPVPPQKLQTSRSEAAVPLTAQVNVKSEVLSKVCEPSTNGSAYRAKGQPQGQEMEDSDSGDEHPDDTIQVSRSVAQQRLAALAGRRSSDRGPHPPPSELIRPKLHTVATAPIPFGHPYNLPAPAPPSTPRTTRRQMLSTELSESLRRNLLWERQVSKINMMGGGRRQNNNGALGNGLRPLTSTTSVNVKKEEPSAKSKSNDEQAEKKRAAMARNRSWADDSHFSGW